MTFLRIVTRSISFCLSMISAQTLRVVARKNRYPLCAKRPFGPDHALVAGCESAARAGFPIAFQRSSRALTLSGVGEKGGARLLGRAAVRPFHNIINGLKNRLRSVWERSIIGPQVLNCRISAANRAIRPRREVFWSRRPLVTHGHEAIFPDERSDFPSPTKLA
jgi:hypothetical protein